MLILSYGKNSGQTNRFYLHLAGKKDIVISTAIRVRGQISISIYMGLYINQLMGSIYIPPFQYPVPIDFPSLQTYNWPVRQTERGKLYERIGFGRSTGQT